MSCGYYNVIQQDHYDSADECDEKYPGSRTCDDLRDSGDNFIAAIVRFCYCMHMKGQWKKGITHIWKLNECVVGTK